MELNDLLYQIFEKHLFTPATDQQAIEDFSQGVVDDYLRTLAMQGVLVPTKLRHILEMDLVEEVMDMARKKTYGYSSLFDYRSQNSTLIEKIMRRAA